MYSQIKERTTEQERLTGQIKEQKVNEEQVCL